MIIAITGTPGTGKTSVSKILQDKGYKIVDLNNIAFDKGFLLKRDEKRDSEVVDIKKLDEYIKQNYKGKELIFIEGHLSHLLKSVNKIIILRCHPKELRKNLNNKGWEEEKIKENLEAEILDIILCEAIEIHPKNNIFEIDITAKTENDVATSINELIYNKFKNIKKYNLGKIDWSEEILKDFKG
jgi:adenylate kinase